MEPGGTNGGWGLPLKSRQRFILKKNAIIREERDYRQSVTAALPMRTKSYAGHLLQQQRQPAPEQEHPNQALEGQFAQAGMDMVAGVKPQARERQGQGEHP